MFASQHFNITKTDDDDWFDPILSIDTPLFLDPFAVFKEKEGYWADAHDIIIQHFEKAFLMIAESNFNPVSVPYRKALAILLFKEPQEFCLGYTAEGVDGAGGGKGLAKAVASAIVQAIKRGLKNPKHFEELGVLQEKIGRDKISDISLNILKPKLITYTHKIAERHNIPMETHKVYAASFDNDRKRFLELDVNLPTNPFSKRPVMFVPKRFLDDLPLLNADDWWNFYEETQQLKDDLNYTIMGKVDKAHIIEVARENPDVVREWTIKRESKKATHYDFKKDKTGLLQWVIAANDFSRRNPLIIEPPQTHEQFFEVIDSVINQFKLYIEEQGGWSLLWNEKDGDEFGKEKREIAAQLLFKGIAGNYCRANNISLDAEVNLGRGPVDFKFSNGYIRRAHLEVKKVNNGKFWDGINHQLPSYLNSDEITDGWFVAIRLNDTKISIARVKDLPSIVEQVAKDKGLNLRHKIIDARPKESASNIRDTSN